MKIASFRFWAMPVILVLIAFVEMSCYPTAQMGTDPPRIFLIDSATRAQWLRVGMTKSQVESMMGLGKAQVWGCNLRHVQKLPHKLEKHQTASGVEINVLYYAISGCASDILDESLLPVFLVSDSLVGVGWEIYNTEVIKYGIGSDMVDPK
jgi:hypothetical protein